MSPPPIPPKPTLPAYLTAHQSQLISALVEIFPDLPLPVKVRRDTWILLFGENPCRNMLMMDSVIYDKRVKFPVLDFTKKLGQDDLTLEEHWVAINSPKKLVIRVNMYSENISCIIGELMKFLENTNGKDGTKRVYIVLATTTPHSLASRYINLIDKFIYVPSETPFAGSNGQAIKLFAKIRGCILREVDLVEAYTSNVATRRRLPPPGTITAVWNAFLDIIVGIVGEWI